MLSEKLKELTKTNHQLLEGKLIAKMRLMRTRTDYSELLSLFYSYFGGLEIGINSFIDRSFLPDYSERRKTNMIADDLHTLQSIIPQLANGNYLPQIKNHAQALGALYVIEGSTLGGQIITKMISKQLNILDNAGLSFFTSYGVGTPNMWQIFKLALNEQPIVDHETVITSANDTFLKFGQWFDTAA